MAENWSHPEVEVIVADYLEMLQLQESGVPFNKAKRNRHVQQLTGRSKGSVEYKHQNISAVLIRADWPYVTGYKPAWNVQRLLEDVVLDRISTDDQLIRSLAAAAAAPAAPPKPTDILAAEVEAPAPAALEYTSATAERRQPAVRVTDFVGLEARNRSLGREGEKWVVAFEKARLAAAGLARLAGDVEHVAETKGDGLGYDVLSFDRRGRERFIEVKTTGYGIETPFYISRNELAFARQEVDKYRLYRVFQYRTTPRLYRVEGPVEGRFRLDPTIFRAIPGPIT